MKLKTFIDSTGSKFLDRIEYSGNLALFSVAILSSLYDTVSTILCIKTAGHSYEGNIFIREVTHSFGVSGFVVIKSSLTLLALLATYFIIKYKDEFG